MAPFITTQHLIYNQDGTLVATRTDVVLLDNNGDNKVDFGILFCCSMLVRYWGIRIRGRKDDEELTFGAV